MAMSKREKMTAARKNAEAQKAMRKQTRDSKMKASIAPTSGKGRKSLVGASKKKK